MSSKKATTKGIRYSDAQKKEIVDFVVKYNSDNGRGGQSEAAKKYNVSQLTVATWLKKSGVKKAPKAGAAKAPKAPKAAKAAPVKTTGSLESKLNSLVALNNQIAKLESEIASLKSKFASIKASL